MRCLLVLLVAVGCTKPNPNRCCTDAVDCDAKGIPVGSICETGLVCRGNQCIAQPCATSAECDPAAPYCSMDLCAEACTADAECPGFAESTDATFCVDGQCVGCRDANDCSSDAPVCNAGMCRACVDNTECDSGVCNVDSGSCVAEAAIAYAAQDGSASSACARQAPCTLARAFAIVDATRPHVKLAPGTHTLASATLTFPFNVTVYGPATIASGDLTYKASARFRLQDLTLAANVVCALETPNAAMPTLELERVAFAEDFAVTGAVCILHMRGVSIKTTESFIPVQLLGQLAGSGGAAVSRGAVLVADRCTFDSVGNPAIVVNNFSSFDVSNTLFKNTVGYSAIQADLTTASSSVEFSTFHNTTLTCNNGGAVISSRNNIILNERADAPANSVGGSSCTHTYTMVKPQAAAVLGTNNIVNVDPRFVNAAAGDFHLSAGSPAIDAADPSATEAVDFDGTLRPQGAARDIGAFEYKP